MTVDLIELDGDDLRREPIERRKVLLMRLLAKASVGLQVRIASARPTAPAGRVIGLR
jgi:ATP-dependent DNA ligase